MAEHACGCVFLLDVIENTPGRFKKALAGADAALKSEQPGHRMTDLKCPRKML